MRFVALGGGGGGGGGGDNDDKDDSFRLGCDAVSLGEPSRRPKKPLPGQFERAKGSLKPFKISPRTWRRTTGLHLQYITLLYVYINILHYIYTFSDVKILVSNSFY